MKYIRYALENNSTKKFDLMDNGMLYTEEEIMQELSNKKYNTYRNGIMRYSGKYGDDVFIAPLDIFCRMFKAGDKDWKIYGCEKYKEEFKDEIENTNYLWDLYETSLTKSKDKLQNIMFDVDLDNGPVPELNKIILVLKYEDTLDYLILQRITSE